MNSAASPKLSGPYGYHHDRRTSIAPIASAQADAHYGYLAAPGANAVHLLSPGGESGRREIVGGHRGLPDVTIHNPQLR